MNVIELACLIGGRRKLELQHQATSKLIKLPKQMELE